jgi:hypothetical protein
MAVTCKLSFVMRGCKHCIAYRQLESGYGGAVEILKRKTVFGTESMAREVESRGGGK